MKNKEVTESDLRSGYRKVRVDLDLTLYDASKLLGMTPLDLSRLENGAVRPIEFEKFTTSLVCHRCRLVFIDYPVKGAVFASYVCAGCRTPEIPFLPSIAPDGIQEFIDSTNSSMEKIVAFDPASLDKDIKNAD